MSFRRPETAQEAVLSEIRHRIVLGQLRPGEVIPQDALSADFGVSRVPVREALRILEGEGQVLHKAHHGYFVASLDIADLRQIYRMREILEGEVVRVAVTSLSQAKIEALKETAKALEEIPLDDVSAALAANRRFHFQLFEGASLPHFERHIRLLWDASDSYRARYYMTPESRSRANTEHKRIIAALEQRNADFVVQELNRHRQNAVLTLASIFETNDETRNPQ